MRNSFKHIDKYKIETPPNYAKLMKHKNSEFIGAYEITFENSSRQTFLVMASIDKYCEWEHVSVSVLTADRTPKWNEMSYIKDLFFEEDEYVIQFHPAKKDYINFIGNCLHLWRNRLYPQRIPDGSNSNIFDRESECTDND